MSVGILGSGLMGGQLGTVFARAGHEVVFSHTSSQKKLEGLARDGPRNAREHRVRPHEKRTPPSYSPCIGPEWKTC
jgi:predicted dinucleotide-binding enzyme